MTCDETPLDFKEIYYFTVLTIPARLQIWGTVLKQYEYIKGGQKKDSHCKCEGIPCCGASQIEKLNILGAAKLPSRRNQDVVRPLRPAWADAWEIHWKCPTGMTQSGICIWKATFNFKKVRIVVSDFQPQGQPGLTQKLQQVTFMMRVCSQNHGFFFQGGEGPCRDRQIATQRCRYTGAGNTPPNQAL